MTGPYFREMATAACAVLLTISSTQASQGDWVLPPKSGVLNVVRDSGVDNTGRTDVTAKLNSIIGSAITRQWIYLPKGTYLVSDMVAGPFCGAGGTARGPAIVGESRTGTVIRLRDGTWPTGTIDPTTSPHGVTSQVVMHGGDCGNTAFGKEMHNFTVDIGSNNDGATGVAFVTANYGGISNIDVISRDGKGCIGVALSGIEIGPAYATNIHVTGFRVGIYSEATDDITISQIRLENQSRYGVLNVWGAEIDSLSFSTTFANVPAVLNYGNGRLVVLNSFFTGNSTGAALVNQGGRLFARNIHSAGYQRAISSTNGSVSAPTATAIGEYSSHGSSGTWYTPGASMKMEVKYPPMPAWEQDTSKWTDINRFKGGGLGIPSRADTTAFRMAWTSGRPNIELSYNRTVNVRDTLYIEGGMERVVGTVGEVMCPIVIRNNTPPVVVVQFLHCDEMNPITIVNRSSKTVILQSVIARLIADGTGDLFVTGLAGRITVRNPLQKVWVRDFNGEGQWALPHDSADVVVENGQAWLLGYKSENGWSKANCFAGFLELLGILQYGGLTDQDEALFNVSGNGQFSLSMLTQVSFGGIGDWTNLVFETRGSERRVFSSSVNPNGSNVALYTGYNQVPLIAGRATEDRTPLDRFDGALLRGTTLEVAFTSSRVQPVTVRVIDMRGRVVASHSDVFGMGVHQRRYSMVGFAPGAYCIKVQSTNVVYSLRAMILLK